MEFTINKNANTGPLVYRSVNTHLPSRESGHGHAKTESHDTSADLKAATANTMEYHRQVLKEKMDNQENVPGHYISPSDKIMSPCTKKLSDLKGKRFKNAGKSQNPFAKTVGKKSFESRLAGLKDSEQDD